MELGDVTNWREWDIPRVDIDLLVGGSPCQGFSFAGKQLNFEDPRSKLFFEYCDILGHIKSVNPSVLFLLENVKMKKEYEEVINERLGCEPILINSALVSAQNRKRLYWTSIPNVEMPEDKELLLKDIVHEFCDTENAVKYTARNMRHYKDKDKDKSLCVTATCYKGAGNNGTTLIFEALAEYIVPFDKTLQILDKEVQRGKIGYFSKNGQPGGVYRIHDRAMAMFGKFKKNYFQYDLKGKGHGSQDQRAYYSDGKHGTLPSKGGGSKCKVLIDENYLFGCITPDRVNKRRDGQRFNDGRKFYTLTAQDRHGVLVEGYIRKLTPVERERLQTLPDNYTEGVSNTQRYKMLGNGFTCAVIRHILSYIGSDLL